MDCTFKCNTILNRVLILLSYPKILQKDVKIIIGQPEDYTKMALRLATEKKDKIDAVLPDATLTTFKEPITEEKKVVTPQDILKKLGGMMGSRTEPRVNLLKELLRDMTKWTVKVRVIKKGEAKNCRNGMRIQKLQVKDIEETEMPILLFNESVSIVGDLLTEGKVKLLLIL